MQIYSGYSIILEIEATIRLCFAGRFQVQVMIPGELGKDRLRQQYRSMASGKKMPMAFEIISLKKGAGILTI